MAPVDIYSSASLVPTLTVFSHILTVGYLTTLVGRTAYRSYLTLPPSSATRHREPLRKGHVHIFLYLALLSIAVGSYYGYKCGSLSYRIWAHERGIALPESFFGDRGAFRSGEHPGRLHVVRWLDDTTFYQEVLEIVTEKSQHFWWGQQITLATVSWSNFVAIEGQRRRIPYLWAFMGLAQLVNLAFAQNLFFITLLLTPVPLPENIKDLTQANIPITSNRLSQLKEKFLLQKPEGWTLAPVLNTTVLLTTYFTIFLIPFASNTPSFITIITLSKILPFLPLLLPYFIPQSWGSISHAHQAYSANISHFRIISTVSILLHLKATVLTLVYNTPWEALRTQPLLNQFTKRRPGPRGETVIARLFEAVGEHPAVGAVGWDVLLSGLSLGIWAAVRGLDAKTLLGVSIPFFPRPAVVAEPVEKAIDTIKVGAETLVENIESPTKRRVGRPRKEIGESSSISSPAKRGRPRKHVPEDASYEPSEGSQLEEGDEDTEQDAEMAAFTWGLITAGGLGAGSAGVYGAEILAR